MKLYKFNIWVILSVRAKFCLVRFNTFRGIPTAYIGTLSSAPVIGGKNLFLIFVTAIINNGFKKGSKLV